MKIKVGLIGAGRMGCMHAENVVAHGDFELAAVFDVDEQRTSRLAGRFHAKPVSSIEELLDASRDAVVIASAANNHSAPAIAAARAGKAVYLEKPIDLDFGKALATANELKKTGVPTMIGFNRRFDRLYRELREALCQEDAGRVQLVRMSSRGPNTAPSDEYLKHSGGMYRDKSVHFFDLVRYLTQQDVVEVSAMGSTLADSHVGSAGDVDTCVVQLRLADESFCQIDNAWRAIYGFDERVETFTTGGLMVVGGPVAGIRRADIGRTFGTTFPNSFMERFADAFAEGINAFARLIRGGQCEGASVDDAIEAELVAEAAVLSSAEHRVVSIDEVARRLGRWT